MKLCPTSLFSFLPTVGCGFGSFFAAEILRMNGIFAILGAGMVMSRYVTLNISDHSNHSVHTVLSMLASTSEMFSFLFMGGCHSVFK